MKTKLIAILVLALVICVATGAHAAGCSWRSFVYTNANGNTFDLRSYDSSFECNQAGAEAVRNPNSSSPPFWQWACIPDIFDWSCEKEVWGLYFDDFQYSSEVFDTLLECNQGGANYLKRLFPASLIEKLEPVSTWVCKKVKVSSFHPQVK